MPTNPYGADALQALTTGTNNVAVGSFTLDALTDASYHDAVGYLA